MRDWTNADIPDQHGRTALVTGGNSGTGWYEVLALADKGARVLLASRDVTFTGLTDDAGSRR